MIEKYGYDRAEDGDSGARRPPYNKAIRDTVAHVKAVREAVGPDVDIGVDVHAKFF
jgi:L-alanine-DL-glutamate epimerase-like enolase superfamily enzyme